MLSITTPIDGASFKGRYHKSYVFHSLPLPGALFNHRAILRDEVISKGDI